MSFKQSIPASKAEVYVSSSVNWAEAARMAKEAGFQFVTHEGVIDGSGSGSGYIVNVDDDGYSIYASGVYNRGPQLNYNKLPDTAPHRTAPTFESRVLEFINDPARSDRNGLYQRLANDRFFASNPVQQRQIVEDILKSGVFCKNGQHKFKKHMGDLMGPTTITFEVTLDIADAIPFAGGLDLSEKIRYRAAQVKCADAAAVELDKQGINY